MALHDYLTSEIAVDHRDGLLTRREALRRLGLMGLGATAAASLLAACASDDSAATQATTTTAGGSSASTGPTTTAASTTAGSAATTTAPAPAQSSTTAAATSAAQAVSFPGPAGTLLGYYAAAATPKGAVLLIHENRGLTDHFKALPNRFAASGYSALSLDLLSRQGGTAAIGDEAKVTAALGAAPADQLVADMRGALDELARRAPGKKLAIVGFCFGGGQVWSLLAAGEPRLAAAAPFYGPGPASPDFSGSKAAVFGVYAEKDTRVNASKDAVDAALTKANLPHELRVFPGVDHAFFNDTGARYDATQANAAYAAVTGWFDRYLA